jgi:hypothetical protein
LLQYRFCGCGNWKASARGNSIKGQQAGKNSILFARDNALVTWELPPLLLRGKAACCFASMSAVGCMTYKCGASARSILGPCIV